MFVGVIYRPDPCPGTDVKDPASLEARKIWWRETKLVVKGQEE